jgi:predicted nucleic acid-binding protein
MDPSVLERFFEPFESLPFDDAHGQHYEQLRADLKRTGQPIGPKSPLPR